MSSEEDVDYELVTEESSESEPELECPDWDSDCTVLRPAVAHNVLGRHLMPTAEGPRAKRPKLACEMRAALLEAAPQLKKCYKENLALKTEDFELISEPYQVCVVDRLIDGATWLERLKRQLFDVDFNLRHLDLYEFFQSQDLKHLDAEPIKEFYGFLQHDLKKWVSAIVDADLTGTSVTCSLYTHTDYLLVHDDQREDRLVAFIFYLTDDWGDADGGALQLFDRDQAGQPVKAVRNLLPRHNQLVFFPVTNHSYHQVSEIIGLNKCRLSINGWFHTKTPPLFEPPPYKPSGIYADTYFYPKTVDIDIAAWINADYLATKTIERIQRQVEQDSEISLRKFFKPEPLKAVVAQLGDVDWVTVGPGNRLRYEVAPASRLPHVIGRLLDLFQSSQMFLLLHGLTNLDLTKVKLELQRWTPGSYTLLSDYVCWTKNELDLLIYFGCKKPERKIVGARTHYVTVEDEVQNALMTIEPKENVLNLVYRDSARFTKYFSSQSECQCFYRLICSYSE